QADLVAQLGRRLDLLTVHGDDHVADFDAGLLGRGARLDLADERAAVDAEAERLGEPRQNVLDPDADPASLGLSVREQLIDDLPPLVPRDPGADGDGAAWGRGDCCVDAGQSAFEPDERAGRATRIDRSVRLNEILVTLDVDAAAAEGA